MVCKTLQLVQTKIPQFMIDKRCDIHKKQNKDHNFTFSLGIKSTHLKMIAGSFYIPKDNNQRPLGEGAHFICSGKNTVGIADGVGGWAAKGVDAGEYARSKMNNSLIALMDKTNGFVNPAGVLTEAYYFTLEEGSSTACVISLNGKFLDFANVGGSGLMVFRHKKMIYRPPVQQRRFNCPYQLGMTKDSPSSAYEHTIIVKGGDVVVAGTDGLLDNMYPSEILEILNQFCDEEPRELAPKIAEFVLLNARSKDYYSPFEQSAEMAGVEYEGGKYDDITIIVAKIA